MRGCGADGQIQLGKLLLNLAARRKNFGVSDALTAAEDLSRGVEHHLNILVFNRGRRLAQSCQNSAVDQVIGKLLHFLGG